jgi:hypothetical protein
LRVEGSKPRIQNSGWKLRWNVEGQKLQAESDTGCNMPVYHIEKLPGASFFISGTSASGGN